MELQVYAVIFIVFFASLISLLFINAKLRGGKTFEDVLAEKRQLADRLYGSSHAKFQKKQQRKQVNTTKRDKKDRKARERKEQQEQESLNDSDAQQSDSHSASSNSPSHHQQQQQQQQQQQHHHKGQHVEFSEAEIIDEPITTTTHPSVQSSNANAGGSSKNVKKRQDRKNSASKPILINKTDTILLTSGASISSITTPPAVEQLNHFDETIPKDDVEIKKHRDEVAAAAAAVTSSAVSISNTASRKDKFKNKERKASPKIDKLYPMEKQQAVTPTTSINLASSNLATAVTSTSGTGNTSAGDNITETIEITTVQQTTVFSNNTPSTTTAVVATSATAAAATTTVQKDSPKNHPSKEKLNKKKKNEHNALAGGHLSNAFIVDGSGEDINVNAMMRMLGRADLTRSEIQILIDYLLNKQQDTIVNLSDWSDDLVQKLKKQLQEKDEQLAEELKAAAGFQAKLREMRSEINGERVQNQAKLTNLLQEVNQKNQDIENMSKEIAIHTERFTNEKHAMVQQIQQLHNKLAESTQSLSQDNFSKNRMIADLQDKFHQIQNETQTKITEYEQKIQEYDRRLNLVNAEMQRLRADAGRKEEYEKICQVQKFDLEQLKQQLTEQNKKTNHMDDSSKVEMRNLQNALDSSMKEVNMYKSEVKDQKQKLDDLGVRFVEQTGVIDAVKGQLQTNWDTVDELKALLAKKESSLVTYEQQVEKQNQQIVGFQQEIVEIKDKNNKLTVAAAEAAAAAAATATPPPPTPVETPTTPQSPSPAQLAVVENQQIRTKQILERLFPDVPKGPANFDDWIDHIAVYIEKQHNLLDTAAADANNSISNNKVQNTNNNHHLNNNSNANNSNNNITTAAATTTNRNINNTNKGDGGGGGGSVGATKHLNSSSASFISAEKITNNDSGAGGGGGRTDGNNVEDLILQNAKLQSTVNEYKTIVAETESVLKNLENKVKEQDSYWRSVVDTKEREISTIKTTTTNNVSI